MSDLFDAEQKVKDYKYDYSVYLIILDKFMLDDAIESHDVEKMKMMYNCLVDKYNYDVCKIIKSKKSVFFFKENTEKNTVFNTTQLSKMLCIIGLSRVGYSIN